MTRCRCRNGECLPDGLYLDIVFHQAGNLGHAGVKNGYPLILNTQIRTITQYPDSLKVSEMKYQHLFTEGDCDG